MNKNKYKYIILALMCLAAFVASFCQYQISPLGKTLMEAYNLTTSQFSSICTVGMVPSILCSIICGMLVDRFGTKTIICLGMFVGIIGLFVRLYAKAYLELYILMMLPGFAATFINATAAKIFGQWFEIRKVGVMIGLFQAFNAIGQMSALMTTNLFSDYKKAFIFGDILYVIIFVLWLVFMKDSVHKENTKITIPKEVITSKTVIITALIVMIVFGSYNTITTFMASSLQAKGYSLEISGIITSIIAIARFCGCLCVPSIIMKNTKRNIVVAIIVGLLAILTFIILRIDSKLLILVCLFITGFLSGGLLPALLSIPISTEEIGQKYAGIAGGILTTFQMFGAVVIPTYICAPIGGTNYEVIFMIASLLLILAAILCIYLPSSE